MTTGAFLLSMTFKGKANHVVGAAGFEPATSCSQGRRANQAALRPDPLGCQSPIPYHFRQFAVKEKG
jgi:hypothetical protein